MKTTHIISATLLFVSSVAFASDIEIYRDLPDPHQGEYHQQVFMIDSKRLEALPRSDRSSRSMDLSVASKIAVDAALKKQTNLNKFQINKVELLGYEKDLASYSPTIREFYRVQVEVLTDVSSGTRDWHKYDYLVFQDGSVLEGKPASSDSAQR